MIESSTMSCIDSKIPTVEETKTPLHIKLEKLWKSKRIKIKYFYRNELHTPVT